MHLLDEMNRELLKTEGRHAHPTAGVIDRQSVKPTESGGVRGYDAGKKIKGHKRHIGTYTTGLRVGLEVHSAGVQDRDGAPDVLNSRRALSHAAPRLCGRRLCGPQTARHPEGHRTLDCADRQALRYGAGL